MDNPENEETLNQNDPMVVIEEALTFCTFGKFHIKLLFASFCAIMSAIVVTSTSSFILPIAECDLNMDTVSKGWLNFVPYLGQAGSCLFVGFLVDTFGRRIFLLLGNLGIFVCGFLEGSSQTYWVLFVLKLLEGAFMGVSYAAIFTMMSEVIQKELRDRMLLILGSFISLSIIVISLMSWAILPQTQLYFVIWKDYFEIHSWNIYLYVCSMWSLLAFILYYMLPESPKFLLSEGHNEKALEVLKLIYHENTGKDKSTFPLQSLRYGIATKSDKNLNLKKQIVNSFLEVKHLVDKIIIYRLILFCCTSLIYLSTYTYLRLWFPQISTIVEHYYNDHGQYSQLCEMMNDRSNQSLNISDSVSCVPVCTLPSESHLHSSLQQVSGSETYAYSILLGVTSFSFVTLATVLVHWTGHRPLMFGIQLSSAASAAALLFSNSSILIAIFISAICAFMQAIESLQSNIIVRIFPTKLRVLAFSLVLIVGRVGSFIGSVYFPVLLEINCLAPFLILFVTSLCQACGVYFLPDPNKENKNGDK